MGFLNLEIPVTCLTEGKMFIGAGKVGHSQDLNYQWASKNNTDLSGYPSSEGDMLNIYNTLFANFVKTM